MTEAVYCRYEIWVGNPYYYRDALGLRAKRRARAFFDRPRTITSKCDAAATAGCPTGVQDQYSTRESRGDVGEAADCDGGHFLDRESGEV